LTTDFNLSTFDSGHHNGIWTISSTTALPVITVPVVIDAASQPGYNGPPVVVLNRDLWKQTIFKHKQAHATAGYHFKLYWT
jgi:hypothetical protein